MKITHEWVKQNMTKNGGYTRSQLELIGVPWPPPKGWKRRVRGNLIDDDSARAFEEIARKTREAA